MKIALNKSLIILGVLYFISYLNKINAQTIGDATLTENQQETSPLPLGVHYKKNDIARDVVYLLPGFKALGTSDFSLVAKTDPTIIVPIEDTPEATTDAYLPVSTATDASYTVDKTIQLGYTKGDYSVTPTGGSAYTIPISVSPGSNGMEPAISIVYNSQAGNGMLGYGWELTGISSIVRVSPTIYQDGAEGAITFTTNDRLSFNGQRLYPTSGNYWDAAAVYATEAESFSTITTKQNSDGTLSFEVVTRDGTIMEFGNNSDARHNAVASDNSTQIMSWRVSKITDINGNFMTFTYLNGKSISTIEYTGNTSGKSPYNSVVFDYDQRPDQSHSYFNYGGKTYDFTEDLLLKSITVMNEDAQVKKYVFDYVHDVYSKLVKVTESDAKGNPLNPTKITWNANHTPASIPAPNPLASITINPTSVYSGDFDGDGNDDIVAVDAGATVGKLYLKNATTGNFDEAGTMNFTGYIPKIIYNADFNDVEFPGYVADLNNDGISEFYQSVIGNSDKSNEPVGIYKYVLENGQLNESFLYNIPSVPEGLSSNDDGYSYLKMIFGDFNGDKKSDYIAYLSDNIGKLTSQSSSYPINNLNDFITNSQGYSIELAAGDFNGNGITDIMVKGDGATTKIIEFNTSTNNFELIANLSGSYVGYPGDFNGDGKTDFLEYIESNKTYTLHYSDGESYAVSMPVAINTAGTNSSISVGDFNGDGITEFARTFMNASGVSTIEYYFNTGESYQSITAPLSVSAISSNTNFALGDCNGDGTSDFIFLNNASNNSMVYSLDNNYPLKVSMITNGFRKYASFTYSPLASSVSFYNPQLVNTDPNARIELGSNFDKNFKMPLVAVKSLLEPDGTSANGAVQINYKYQGARLHLLGRGFLGFELITAYSSDLNFQTVTNYKINSMYWVPYVYSVKTSSYPSLKLLSTITYTNQFTGIGSIATRYLTYVSQTVDTDGLTGVTQTRASVIDNTNGNVTKTTATYGSDGTTVTDYSNFIVVNGVQRAQTKTVTKTRTSKSPFILTTTYTFDASGRVQKTTITDASTNWQAVEISNRDSYGNPTNMISNATGVVPADYRTNSITYDPYGRFPVQTTNALGQSSNITYNSLFGKPTVVTGIDGLTTTNEYDDMGRLIRKTGPDGITTTYSYSFAITPPVTTALYYTQETTPGKPTLTIYYDLLERKVYNQTDGTNDQIISKQQYNAQGQVLQTSIPKYSSTETDQWIVYDYYETNRIRSSTDRGRATTYVYADNSTNITTGNPDGTSTNQTTNAYGDVINATDALNNVTTYTYHSCGSPDLISNNGVDVIIHYDAKGRKMDVTEPSSGKIIYTYTKFGELETVQDNKGITTYDSYDKLSRPLSKTVAEYTTTYSYYGSGAAVGKLQTSAVSSGPSQSYFYDNLGRLNRSTEVVSGRQFNTIYSYDTYSNISGVTYPSNLTLNYTYDAHGFMTAIHNSNGNALIWQLIGANALGQLTAGKFGNNLSTAYTYDANNLLQSITAGSIFNYQTSFDGNNGNLNYRYQTVNNVLLREIFGYDNLNHLTSSQIYLGSSDSPYLTATYGVDGRGNITEKSDVGAYSYTSGKPDVLDHISETNGPIPTTRQDITYTTFGKVNTIIEGVNSAAFIYGADDQRRVMQISQNGVLQKSTFYIGNYELETDPENNQVERTYIVSPYGLVGMQYNTNTTSQILYTHTDHLGSVLVLSNQNGSIAESYSYDAWGRRRGTALWDYGSVPTPTYLTRGFTFHEHLDVFNLVNMNGRLYDPILGRMLSPDPDLHVGSSPYSYADGNPLKYIDPTGQDEISPIGEETPGTNYGNNQQKYYSGNEAEDEEGGVSKTANYNNNLTKGVSSNFIRGGSIGVFSDYTDNEIANGYNSAGKGTSSSEEDSFVQSLNDLVEFLGNYNDYILNTGGAVYGATEIGLSKSGTISNVASKTFGINAARIAGALQKVGGTVGSVAGKVGYVGYAFSAVTFGNAVVNNKLTLSTGVNFGVSTVLYGAAIFTAGTVAAPFVGGAALIYGVSQLGVQLYTGKTIEQNLFDEP